MIIGYACKLAYHNPADEGQVRRVSGAGSPAWDDVESATFANCVVTPAQVGSTGMYESALPTGLDATVTYRVTIYPTTATSFADVPLAQGQVGPDVKAALLPTFQLITRGDASNKSANAADLTALNASGGSYDPLTDSLEAADARKVLLADGAHGGPASTLTIGDGATFSTVAIGETDVEGFMEATSSDLDAIAAAVAEIPTTGGESGDGDVPVTQDLGGTDNLRYVRSGVGIDNAVVRAYLTSEYTAGAFTVRGKTYTGSDGRWIRPMMLDAGGYTFTFTAQGYEVATATGTVS